MRHLLKSQIGFLISAGLVLSSAGVVFGQSSSDDAATNAETDEAAQNVVTVKTLTQEDLAKEQMRYKPQGPWQVKLQDKAWALECAENTSAIVSEVVDIIKLKAESVERGLDEAAQKAKEAEALKMVRDGMADKKCRVIHTGRHDVVELKADPKALKKNLIEMTIDMIKVGKAKKLTPVAIIKTPMNLILPKGLGLSIDGAKPLRFAIRSCHVDLDRAQGQIISSCLAPFQMTGGLLSRFKAGGSVKFTAETLDGKPLTDEISLFGFSKVYDVLAK